MCVSFSIYLCLSIYAVKIYHKNYIPIKHIQPSYINFMWTLTIFCFFNNKKSSILYIYYLSFFSLLIVFLLFFVVVVSITNCFIFEYKKNRIRFYIFFFLSISSFFLFLHIMCVSQCFSIISHMNVFLCVLLFFRALQPTSKISKISKIDIEIFYFFSSLLPQLKLVYN